MAHEIVRIAVILLFLAQPLAAGLEHPTINPKTVNCTFCHDYLWQDGWTVHMPVEVDCMVCHAFKKGERTLEVELVYDEPELCRDCHDFGSEESQALHEPVAESRCTSCHDPHGSGREALLKESAD